MAKVIDATLKLIDQFTPTLRTVNSAIKSNEMAMKSATTVTRAAGIATKKYAKDMQEAEKINQRVSKSITSVGKSISNAAQKMTLLSAGLFGAAYEGIKLNADYTDGLAKVSTALDTTKISLDDVRKGLIDVSNTTGVAVTDLTNAEYQALSAGVDSAKSVQFIGDSMKAAKAGFADAETTINTVTTVLNAYGMQADKATNITDQMITAQNFGKTTFADMGASLGNVIPIAAALDVKTQDLFASIATLSKNGIQTSEAITGLKAAYSNILKVSPKAAAAAKQMGINFSAAHLKAVGWSKFLSEIKEKTGGNVDKMSKLFKSVEALNTVTVLAGKGNADFAAAMDKMANSTGATQEAYEKLLTPAERNRIAMNQLKNAGMELGAGLTPILKRTAILMQDVAHVLNNMSPAQKELLVDVLQFVIISTMGLGVLGKIVTGFGGAFGKVTEFASAVTKAGGVLPLLTGGLAKILGTLKILGSAARMLFLNPWGTAIIAIIGLIYLLYTHWDVVSKFLHKHFDGLGQKVSVVVDKIVGYWNKFMNVSGDSSTKIGKLVNWLSTIFSFNLNLICTAFNITVNLVCDYINTIIDVITIMVGVGIDNFGYFIDFINAVFCGDWDAAWKAVVNIFKTDFEAIKGICDAVLGGVKNAINDVISGINNVNIDIPDWVPGIGGEHFQPNIPMLAKGTDNWQGGPAMIHDAGAEVVNLPQGTQVIPHDKSLKNEYERGKKDSKAASITIAKLADTIVIREDADVNKIAKQLAEKIQAYSMNNAKGAV
ncbi:phage tail tape measure protein [Pectinatus frisingensis]|uniref:phage tail tape measure protein n=1 Tax=Pectinatus frisingensis TaxID=865 RepID=UPI0018C507FA|nr:phage tail tape measure protein [Pectinatus frisingensis]